MANSRFLALNSYDFELKKPWHFPQPILKVEKIMILSQNHLYIRTKLQFLALNLYNLKLKKARRLP